MTTEKFDIEAYKVRKEKDPWYGDIFTLDDGTKIKQSGPTNRDSGAFEWVTPPLPYFYTINKSYHKSTNTLEYKGKLIGGMLIEKTQFFDESGKLVKEVDENEKLEGHSYEEALQFLEKEDWINLETGEGRDRFSLGYENNIWHITIMSRPWNGNLETYYKINATTGEVIKKEETQKGEE